ncbi:TRAP transporter small permease subunit [Halomonas alkalisoli]|uniref:TRAP transporter small permease subunit n=1 Tax=Halomonas alkalisoli TaxID=2907158 RepID=UPI001F165DF4|nr:TRAP transporter small permease [Halomonas alkalisoli]MCE9683460.1 TRAP transporter small permease [Halomonas alkalisoli]
MSGNSENEGNNEGAVSLNLIDRFSIAVSRVAMFLVLVIVVITGYEIIMRYVFSTTMIWTKELSVWLGAISYVLAGLYAMQKRAHIAITLLHDIMPPRVKLVLDLVKLAVILVFAYSIIVGAGPFAWASLMRWETTGTTWGAPVPATIKPLIILTVALIAIQAIANTVSDIRNGPSSRADKKITKVD